MRRTVQALLAAAAAGLLAALLGGLLFEPFEVIGFWGRLWGTVASVGILAVVMGRGRGWVAVAARWLAVTVLGALALGLTWTTAAFGVPLTSLEGAWLWPSTVAALLAWVLGIRWAWRGSRRRREPPSPAAPFDDGA